jgi:hypothetical protein
MSDIVLSLTQRRYVIGLCLLILLVELYLKPLAPDLKSIHLFNRILRRPRILKADKPNPLTLAILLRHYPRTQNRSKLLKQLMQLRILHIIGQMEQKQVTPRRPQFPLRILHIIQRINLLLYIPVVRVVGVKDLRPRGWGLEL